MRQLQIFRSSAPIYPHSGPWKEAVSRQDLVDQAGESRQRVETRMAEIGIPTNRSIVSDVLATPGFAESWERARAQARAGIEVSLGEIDPLESD